MVDDQPGKVLTYEAMLGELGDQHQLINRATLVGLPMPLLCRGAN
jgi:hypothetical protein